jgi:hypothetical protein
MRLYRSAASRPSSQQRSIHDYAASLVSNGPTIRQPFSVTQCCRPGRPRILAHPCGSPYETVRHMPRAYPIYR